MPNRLGERLRRPMVAGRRGRLAIGGVSAVLVAGGVFVLSGGGAGADTSPTQGSSYAQLLQVTPHEGSLAVGAVFGEALAGHTDQIARAQSQGMDLGAVGLSMKGYNCGSPPTVGQFVPDPLQTETGQPNADKGITDGPNQADYGSNEYVLANDKPYGEADTTYGGPVGDPTGGFVVSGMTSKSWSGVVDGTSEAGATADIGSLNIGAGAVVLKGLHWEALQAVGAKPTASFTIGSAVLGGTPLPNLPDLSAVQAAINKVIGAIGLQLQLPVAQEIQGIEFLSPLEIDVVPNTTRDTILQAAVNGLQQPYYDIANGLENGFGSDPSPFNSLGQLESGNQAGQAIAAALCQSDTPITVADITIASLDGGGYFNVALGGVNVTSSPLPQNTYNLAEFGAGLLSPGTSQFIPGTAGTPGTLGTGATAPAPTGATAPTSTRRSLGLTRGHLNGAAGGSLLAAGLGGLGLMAFLVEGDRRKMRRAQRAITAEE